MARLTAAFVAAGLLLVAASTALVGPVFAAPGRCGLSAQDDAGSGQDAGDLAALALPLVEEGTFLGAIGDIHTTGVDLDDWYVVDVPAGERTVMATLDPNYDGTSTPYVTLEAWEEGATEPSYTATENEAGQFTLAFPTTEAGTWHLRVHVTYPLWAPSCAGGLGAPVLSELVTAYGLYYGCDPHCTDLAA